LSLLIYVHSEKEKGKRSYFTVTDFARFLGVSGF
jgi:hypothetical protein